MRRCRAICVLGRRRVITRVRSCSSIARVLRRRRITRILRGVTAIRLRGISLHITHPTTTNRVPIPIPTIPTVRIVPALLLTVLIPALRRLTIPAL